MVQINTSVTVAAAHMVHTADEASPCRRVHGHNWKFEVEVHGDIADDGMVIDFRFIKDIINQLDHKMLFVTNMVAMRNDIDKEVTIVSNCSKYVFPVEACMELDLPSITAEHLSQFVANEIAKHCGRLNPSSKFLVWITCWESEKSSAKAGAEWEPDQ